MKNRKVQGSSGTAACLMAALLCSFSGVSNALEESGTLDVVDCYSGDLELVQQSETDLWASWVQTGTRRSVVPGGAFDQMTGRCVGFLWAREGLFRGHSVCEFVDADRDKVFVESAREGDAITWEFTGGVGKYEGIAGNGIYTDYTYFPRLNPTTYQFCPKSEGVYRFEDQSND